MGRVRRRPVGVRSPAMNLEFTLSGVEGKGRAASQARLPVVILLFYHR